MSATSISGRRSSVEIVHDILTLCNNGGINKTAIMYRCNLSYDQLRRYLAMLCGEDFIFKNDTGKFEITDTGRKALKRMSTAIKSLKELRFDFGLGQASRPSVSMSA